MALTQVKSDGIATGAVTATQIAANAVTVDDIADGSISTAKLADDAVTADKLANTAVTAGSYTFANVTVDAQGRITAASSGTVSSDAISEGNTSAEVVDTGSDGHFKVVTEGTEALRVVSSQRVGIGTTTPDSILHLGFSNSTTPTSGTTPSGIGMSVGGTNGDNGGIWWSADFGGDQGIAGIAGTKTNSYETDLRFYTNNTNAARAFSERMRITSDAYVRLASGTGGIQFNGDTAAANALDDYEYGNWTPTLTDGYTRTYSRQKGTYVKAGRMVTVIGQLAGSTRSGSAGTIAYVTLPFQADALIQCMQPQASMTTYAMQPTGKIVTAAPQWDSPTQLRLYAYAPGDNMGTYLSPSDISASGWEFGFTITYYTDD